MSFSKEACFLISSVFAFSVSGPTWAEPLPKDAVKLKPTEVKAIYSGKSADWTKVSAYFAPNGKLFMVAKDKSFVVEGTWSVKGNQICTKTRFTPLKGGKPGSDSDCTSWFKAGDRSFNMWSKEKDKTNGYEANGEKRLSAGDTVTAEFKALKAKAGK